MYADRYGDVGAELGPSWVDVPCTVKLPFFEFALMGTRSHKNGIRYYVLNAALELGVSWGQVG